MKVGGTPYRTIWAEDEAGTVGIIDQTRLPFDFVTLGLRTLEETTDAIRSMRVRGAPLIGVTAAYGVWLQMRRDASDAGLEAACTALLETRPTGNNLRWALDQMRSALKDAPSAERADRAYRRASELADEDVATCRAIGEHGLPLIAQELEARGGDGPVNVLTHCNAGWLATVDWGTALAPVYRAHDAGIPVHVWVGETRPRNQGASLTAWELGQHGVPHTVIVDNAGGHLMQHGRVDLCIMGTDRTTAHGDVCNKIGTYLKALAARDNGIPFYVALPHSSVDWNIADGIGQIPIEEREADEVGIMQGRGEDGRVARFAILPEGSGAANPGFDVTPARLVTALITERGICKASAEGLAALYPES
ncbi:MAG: S-methyl-5-thioribose-1-phosphate isomerase [Myxococcota bacterium]